ncbi:pre-mRNA-processing protein 40C isoform X3 [Punica granatum]|uniref:Pre-mRNA-processing protein 40C isoform X3 n=1 Tax=Punica granatum TaxID=22663 RepID=A0A6P8CUF3_PUNGR|nr:pre-mRNA-processing protein 40C isoform X3 [Punica granatum]
MQPAAAQAPPPSGSGQATAPAASRDSPGSMNGSTAENNTQTNFANSLVSAAPAPSFSYGVLANANAASPATNSSSTIPHDISSSKPEALPGPPQSTAAPMPLTSFMGTTPLWPSGPQPFAAPRGMLGPTGPLGPPGLASSAPVSTSSATFPSVASDSSSSVRPNMAGGPVSSTPAVQQQVYSPYPSLPPIAANPQGLWLQPPPQMSGMARPPFMQYPAVFPGPFPFPAHGMPQPIQLPVPRPPVITPLGPTSGVTLSSAPGNQFTGNSNTQAEKNPPPVDHNKHVNDINTKDGETPSHLDAWTAHRTESGTVYYYNALTGESTYERPAGFKGEPDDVALQPTPVSTEKVVGSDWEIVTMNDGRKYYYNNKTKISSWQIPTEVSELGKKQEDSLSRENPVVTANANPEEKGSHFINLSAPALNTGGRDAISLRASTVAAPSSSSALDLVKKKLQESGAPGNSSPVPVSPGTTLSESNGLRSNEATGKVVQSESNKEKPKDANGNGNFSDSSSDSEDADSGPTKEECIRQFKEMLKERGVAPFSKWEKELPKLVVDPRFKAIPSYSARRSLFEHYVKTRAEEERKEKKAAQKAAIEGFKQLLDEASEGIDASTDYHTFRKKWGNDPRFEALDRKDRESLLNERVMPLRKAAEEKARALRAAATSSFKSLLRDKGDITVNSRWYRVKDNLRDDPRYRTVNQEDREILFNEYIAELKAAQHKEEQEAKAKRDEQDKLKERERELRKRKEREEQEMERVRLKVRRKEAVASFQALLVEMIKDPQVASWMESRAKLEKDPQRRATNPDLDPTETEKLFREHVKMLHERCAHEFKALLSESITPEAASSQETEDGKTVLNSWSTAKRLLKLDPRYNKMPRKEREALWHRHVDDLLRKQKSGYDNEREERISDPKGRGLGDSGKSQSDSRRKRDRG